MNTVRIVLIITGLLLGCELSSKRSITAEGSDSAWVEPSRTTTAATPVPAALECGDPTDDATELFTNTDDSVHELIACGGLQASLAKRMGVLILLSNPEIFEPDTYDTLHYWASYFGSTTLAFTARPDGGWEVLVPNAGDSWFTLDLYEPGTDVRILQNPFELDSYLVGVQFDAAFDFETARSNPTLRNDYVVTYEAAGPLAHLLGITEPGPGSFTMHFSLLDVAQLIFRGDWPTEATAGRFTTLNRVDVESTMSFYDVRGDSTIHYEASSPRSPLHESVSGVAFEVTGIDGVSGDVAISASTSLLRYVGSAGLAGVIDYSVQVSGELSWSIRSDFREGSLYPESRWGCP